jgi:hypothetical protein
MVEEPGTGDETGVHAVRDAVALEIVVSSVCPLPFLLVMVLVGVGTVLRLAGLALAVLAGESSWISREPNLALADDSLPNIEALGVAVLRPPRLGAGLTLVLADTPGF